MPCSMEPASDVLPLTERVLGHLPGPRLAWMLVWASLPFVVEAVLPMAAGVRISRTAYLRGLLTAYGGLVALWGVGKLGRDVAAVQPILTDLTGGALPVGRLFHPTSSVSMPLVLMGASAAIYGLDTIQRFGGAAALPIALAFVAWLPVATLAWVGGTILLGLHRLGGMPLKLKPFEEDRGLGLRRLGSLAFTPLLVYAAGIIPAVFIGGPTRVEDVVTNVGVLFIIVALLFASLTRLRRQLVAAKARHLAWARDLYVQALAPVRSVGSREALGAQAAELQAAEALERRAAAIQEWPFDDIILRSIAAIVTSVSTALVVRLVLSRLGL